MSGRKKGGHLAPPRFADQALIFDCPSCSACGLIGVWGERTRPGYRGFPLETPITQVPSLVRTLAPEWLEGPKLLQEFYKFLARNLAPVSSV